MFTIILWCAIKLYVYYVLDQVVERPPDTDPIELTFMYKDRGIMASILPEYLGEWAAEKVKCEGVSLMPKS